MKDTTAIVISFLRPAYTKACIRSLRAMYPDIQIVVGENAHHDKELAKVCKEVDARYIQLPYDSGVCVGRNTLIANIETPYVLVGDDDFLYNAEAGVYRMAEFLRNHPEYDVIGGRIRQGGEVRNYQGLIEYRGTHFQTYPIDPEQAIYHYDADGFRYIEADLTFNYFIGRTEKIRAVPWDENIKVAYEHFSWFYDFKVAGGKVAFTPDAIVIHKPEEIAQEVYNSPAHKEYMAYRNRKNDKERFFAKYGIKYTIGMTGTKTYAPDHIVERRKGATKYIDFCITTFMRPLALERLLFSIATYYPGANVYVVDQSEKFDRAYYKDLRSRLYDAGLVKRISVEYLGYDIGLSAARNHLVRTTPNKFKLILDDDMEFTDKTDIGKMVRILDAHPYAGVVGGLVKQKGHEVHFEFNLEVKDGTILQIPDKNALRNLTGVEGTVRYRKTGCVLNFALFRKEVFNYLQWDDNLKITEHTDFYLRWQKQQVPYQILYTPDVEIDHPPAERVEGYKEMRTRPEFLAYMLKKHGAKRLQYLNGAIHERNEDGTITKYKK